MGHIMGLVHMVPSEKFWKIINLTTGRPTSKSYQWWMSIN